MITRTLIVIAVIIAPFLVGRIHTFEIFDMFPTYARGVYYICFLSIFSLIVYAIYEYIMHGLP